MLHYRKLSFMPRDPGSPARDVATRHDRAYDAGFTLVEVMIAISLLVLMTLPFASSYVTSITATTDSHIADVAVTLASTALDKAQALDATNLGGSTLLQGRDCTSVDTQWGATLPPGLSLADTLKQCDVSAATGSGATAPLPTSPVTTSVSGHTFTVYYYVGTCYYQSTGDCLQTPTTNNELYRVIVDVTWSAPQGGCGTAGCDYVASTLISGASDPTFNLNGGTPVASATTTTTTSGTTTTTAYVSAGGGTTTTSASTTTTAAGGGTTTTTSGAGPTTSTTAAGTTTTSTGTSTTTSTTTSTSTTTTTSTSTTTTTSQTEGTIAGSNCNAGNLSNRLDRGNWTASSDTADNQGYQAASNAIGGDGNFSSGSNQAAGYTFTVDRSGGEQGSLPSFSALKMAASSPSSDYARSFAVEVSNDGQSWTTIATCSGSSSTAQVSFSPQTARYVQVLLTGDYPVAWTIGNFNLYGSAGSGG
jgi:prepilin-type N-terminal cleavage/methylation domain-containing protein